jgi:hypothetical protein
MPGQEVNINHERIGQARVPADPRQCPQAHVLGTRYDIGASGDAR